MAVLNREVWARGVLTRAWAKYGTPTAPALQAAQAIARLESGGGYGVTGTSDPAWQGSNNWGAIKCTGTGVPPCGDTCFEHVDTDGQGQVGIYCFQKYATPDDGAAGFLHELMRRPMVAANLGSGNANAIAQAMKHAPAYMGLSAIAYGRLIALRAQQVAKAIGEPLYVTLTGPSSSSSGIELLLTAATVWTAWRGLRKKRG